uniref:Uncharacterized protein n=1 Tax=Chlorobium phaeobacteroides (strain BS1) TaxID=331678 RepID=B3EQX1_CHLPB
MHQESLNYIEMFYRSCLHKTYVDRFNKFVMLNYLTANLSPDGSRDHNAEKSHVLKPCGMVGQLK